MASAVSAVGVREAHREPLKHLQRLRKRAASLRILARYPLELRLFYKYRSFTMSSPQTVTQTLRLCRHVQDIHGDVVECGVWRGGMSAAMAEVLHSRTSVLFDSFEGLPAAQEIDGPSALTYQAELTSPSYRDNCRASEEEARCAMGMAPGVKYRLFRGWFDETIPRYAAEKPNIAVLRLDGDWYDSTALCLEHLFPRVTKDGLVIVDDYGVYDGCTRAVHDYLSRTKAIEPIRRTRSGVVYLVKQ